MDIREVEDLEIDGVDTKDYPDFCDTYFCRGTYKGRELTDEELEKLGYDYPEVLNEMAYEYYI